MVEGTSPKFFSRKPHHPIIPVKGRYKSSGSSRVNNNLPFFYRARGSFGVLLAVNILFGGYMLFHGPIRNHPKKSDHKHEHGVQTSEHEVPYGAESEDSVETP